MASTPSPLNIAKPITDALLDQLCDEMRELARTADADAKLACEDSEAFNDRELASLLHYVADNRGLLVRFAFLLRGSANQQQALAQLVSA